MHTEESRKQHQTTLIIWIAILNSVVIYGVVAWLIEGKPVMADPDSTVLALYAGAAAAAVASFFVPRLLAARARTPEAARTALIVQWALLESLAVFGLLAAFLAENSFFFFPPAAVAFVGILLSRPSASD